MINQLTAKLKLTESEIRVLKRVLTYSAAGCLLLVGVAWAIRYLMVQGDSGEAASRSRAVSELGKLYEKKSDELLPIDIEAHLHAARHYLDTDRPSKAVGHLLRVAPAISGEVSVRLDLASAYLESGRFEQAHHELSLLRDQSLPDSLKALVEARHGLTLFYLGKVRESLEQLKDCIKEHPDQPEAYCYLGQVEAAVEPSSVDALEHFRRAIALEPAYGEARYQQARYFMAQGDYARCRDSLLQLLRIEPLHVRAHSRLGMAYYYLEDADMARKAYRTALALNPKDFNTHYNLGELLYTFYDDPRGALAEFADVLALDPNHAQANFKTGIICLENDQFKEAAKYLERARRSDPDNIRILLQLAVAYERLGLVRKALRTYEAVAEIDAVNEIARQKIRMLSSRGP